MSETTHKLIIIGSGPAGLTAGIYAGRAELNPLIIEGKQPGGQLMGTTYVENWPGEQRILGPQLMKNMREHAAAVGSTYKSMTITKVDLANRPFTLWGHNGEELRTHALIIATGATPNRLGCPGEDEYWGKGVTTCAVCDGAFYKDQPVVIIGGGDTAMEDASFMTKFTDNITVVQILDHLTASAPMKKRVLDNPKIKVIYNSTVKTIRGNGEHVTGLTLVNQKTGQEELLEARAIFVAIGLRPSTQIFKDQLDLDRMGYILTTNETNTSVEGVFAAGDVIDYKYRQAITSAGSGCKAALDAERYLSDLETLD